MPHPLATLGQTSASFAPDSGQNSAPNGASCWRRGHSRPPPIDAVTDQDDDHPEGQVLVDLIHARSIAWRSVGPFSGPPVSRACRSSPRARLVAGKKRSVLVEESRQTARAAVCPATRSAIGVVIADVLEEGRHRAA